jgi:hypothetical protein
MRCTRAIRWASAALRILCRHDNGKNIQPSRKQPNPGTELLPIPGTELQRIHRPSTRLRNKLLLNSGGKMRHAS